VTSCRRRAQTSVLCAPANAANLPTQNSRSITKAPLSTALSPTAGFKAEVNVHLFSHALAAIIIAVLIIIIIEIQCRYFLEIGIMKLCLFLTLRYNDFLRYLVSK